MMMGGVGGIENMLRGGEGLEWWSGDCITGCPPESYREGGICVGDRRVRWIRGQGRGCQVRHEEYTECSSGVGSA